MKKRPQIQVVFTYLSTISCGKIQTLGQRDAPLSHFPLDLNPSIRYILNRKLFISGDLMRKYILIFFLILVLIFTALVAGAGYFVGDYFVNFTLKRGNDRNPHGPPQAYSTILGVKKSPEANKPNYVSEDWQMTLQIYRVNQC